jgi:hydrogenase maturation protease
MNTLVLGLGNPILSDDGVGIQAAEAVRDALAEQGAAAPTEVATACLGGLALMEAMLGYDRVILIDAFLPRDRVPGRVHRMTFDDLRALSQTEHSASPHDTSLAGAVALGQALGLPLPQEIIIYAVEVDNVADFGEQPTPAVAAAIPRTVGAVLSELR